MRGGIVWVAVIAVLLGIVSITAAMFGASSQVVIGLTGLSLTLGVLSFRA